MSLIEADYFILVMKNGGKKYQKLVTDGRNNWGSYFVSTYLNLFDLSLIEKKITDYSPLFIVRVPNNIHVGYKITPINLFSKGSIYILIKFP